MQYCSFPHLADKIVRTISYYAIEGEIYVHANTATGSVWYIIVHVAMHETVIAPCNLFTAAGAAAPSRVACHQQQPPSPRSHRCRNLRLSRGNPVKLARDSLVNVDDPRYRLANTAL